MISRVTSIFAMLGALAPYIVSFFAGALAIFFWFDSMFYSRFQPGAPESSFEIQKGWTLKDISRNLEEKKFIKHWWSVYYLTQIRSKSAGKEKSIQAGEYRISAGMTPAEIIDAFIDGRIVYHEMTIPEGTRAAEFPGLMARTGLVTVEEAERALSDRVLAETLGLPGSFEGYLFPETYKFSRPVTASDMIEKFVDTGKKKITKEMYDRAIDLGLRFDHVLVLASIIEKETGVAEERPTISSVFHNRLRIGMPLQSDPTVIYGIPNFDGNLTKENLNQDTPYNTYIRIGLPPTPICNPGVASIQAALYPAETDYLYFVAKGDGSHHFSATYKEHKQAVDLYQKKLAEAREKLLQEIEPPAAPTAPVKKP